MDQSRPKNHGADHGADEPTRATQMRRFGRMLPTGEDDTMLLTLRTCATLGDLMTAQVDAARRDSEIPAGYTYFGQFVDHDLSFDRTMTDLRGQDDEDVFLPTKIEDEIQDRSPHLDLDSLYSERGDLPGQPSLFVGPKFKIGFNTALDIPSAHGSPLDRGNLQYDLPRVGPRSAGKVAGQALIGDPRNDENLAVAQTHLMWLKFHNHIVDRVQAANRHSSDAMVFMTAKELVVKGSFRFHHEFPLAVRMMQSGRIDPTPLVTDVMPMEDAQSAFERASDRNKAIKVQLSFA